MQSEDITQCLRQIRDGNSSAVDKLLPHVYKDLRLLAERIFSSQRDDHTLQPTALVHEAYMRMVQPENAEGWNDRHHFLRVAALAMRQLLADYGRARNARKRDGGRPAVALDDLQEAQEPADKDTGIDLVCLDEALTELGEKNERQARIVELRFLAGLTVEETAEVLGYSSRSVFLDWSMARAWLQRRLA